MTKLKVKYHPLHKNQKFPTLVDVFRENDASPMFSSHVDEVGDLLHVKEERDEYYAKLKDGGEVVLKVELAT